MTEECIMKNKEYCKNCDKDGFCTLENPKTSYEETINGFDCDDLNPTEVWMKEYGN